MTTTTTPITETNPSQPSITFLCTGPLLAISLLSLALIDPDPPGNSAYILGYFLGSLFAHATLAAAWTTFGPGPLIVRIPASLAWTFLLPVVIAINIGLHSGPNDAPLIMGSCFFAQWLLFQLPLGGIAYAFGVQLRRADATAGHADQESVRFGIRHLLAVMFITGVVLGIGRAISFEGGEAGILIFLAVAGMVVTLPLLLALLLRRMAIAGTCLALLLIGLATAVEAPLLEQFDGRGPAVEHFIAINLASTTMILLIGGIVRLNGYSLSGPSNSTD